MKYITNFNIENKTVILRCDLNVSIKDNKIIDDTRIVKSLKTINYILDHKAKLIIMSHLGKIKCEEDKIKNSMEIVYKRLNELLPNKITFVPYTKDERIKKELDNIDYGHGILLENTRFEDLNNKKESNCDEELSKYWASLGDIFINDAFGMLHRGHASNLGISTYLPSGIGFLVKEELTNLNKLDNPKRPYAIIMGGAKVSDKIKIIDNLITKVDKLFIGGAMAFTFLKSKGIKVGNSLVEDEYLDYCAKLLKDYPNKIILPIDFNGSLEGFKNDPDAVTYNIMNIPDNFIGMDIGPKSIGIYKDELSEIKTIFWNGPLGVYEFDKYQTGTKEILNYIANNIETTIVGGGDIVSCANKFGFNKKLTYISTGGGASLEYIVNKDLPGLKNIKE